MPKKKELNKAITRVVRRATNVCPNLTYSVRIPGYEEEDANIVMYCPSKYEEKVRRAVHREEYKLLSGKDIFIASLIYPLNHKHRKSA